MTEQEICEQFPRMMQRMGKVVDELFIELLPKQEFIALCILSDGQKKEEGTPGIYVSMLAAAMQSSPPGVSRLLRTMEEQGLVERTVDRADRRNTFVAITEKGEWAKGMLIEKLGEVFLGAIQQVGVVRVEEMLAIMEQFTSSMEEKAKEIKEKEIKEKEENAHG